MAEQLSMDDILSDKPVERPAPAAEPAPAAAEPAAEAVPAKPSGSLRREHQKREFEAQGRDPETGKFLPKEEPKAEPAKEPAKAEATKEPEKAAEPAKTAAPQQEEMTPKEKAAFAKAADETRKRQALEAQLRQLQANMQQRAAAPQGQPQGQPQAAPQTFWDDPEGALKRTEANMQQAILSSKLQTAEAIARSRYKDFDEKVGIFKDLAMTTPGLAQQMVMAPDPAEFAYRTAANHKAIQDAGGVDALVSKAREEERAKVRQELEAELKAKADALAKERAALPGSLSDAPSKGTNRPVWGGPPSMDDILTGK